MRCAPRLDPWEPIGTFETEYELFLHQLPNKHHVVHAWEVRAGSGERAADGRSAGMRTIEEQIIDSFRFSLGRQILGEIRGPEVWQMVKLMESGSGSISTTHAADGQAAIRKLITCAMEAGPQVSQELAAAKLADTLDLVVHLTCDVTHTADGDVGRKHRYVSEILEVTPGERPRGFATNTIFAPAPGPLRGRVHPSRQPVGRPDRRRVQRAGLRTRTRRQPEARMNPSLLASLLAGAMIPGGLLLTVVGLRHRPAPPPRPSPPAAAARAGWRGCRRWRRTAAGRRASWPGSSALRHTGWVVLVVLLPLAVVGLPVLLATSDAAPRIARMEAIAEWTRNLSGVLTAGQALEQALHASLRSTPDAIRPEVSQLIGRLRARWSTEAALRAFADDLDDATGDLVVAALILGSRKRGDGLARVLTGLAESVAEDVQAADSSKQTGPKPRSSARTTTLISVGALVVLGMSGQFLAPYGTPLGQVLLAAVPGCLRRLRGLAEATRRRTRGRPVRRSPEPRCGDERLQCGSSPGS